MTKQTRKDFETWAKLKNYDLLKSRGGSYLYVQSNITWKAWQAATKATYERVQIDLDATASKLAEWTEKSGTLGQKYSPITLGQVELLRDIAAAIRQGGDV